MAKPTVEVMKQQWQIMVEDEENYKKFMDNDDLDAFDKLVERLIKRLG